MGAQLGKEFVVAIKNKGKFLDIQENAKRLMVRGDPETGNILTFDSAIKKAWQDFQDNDGVFKEIKAQATKDREAAEVAAIPSTLTEIVTDAIKDSSIFQATTGLFFSGDPAQIQGAEAIVKDQPVQHSFSVDGATYDIPDYVNLGADNAEAQLITYLTTRYRMSETQAKQIIDREFRAAGE